LPTFRPTRHDGWDGPFLWWPSGAAREGDTEGREARAQERRAGAWRVAHSAPPRSGCGERGHEEVASLRARSPRRMVSPSVFQLAGPQSKRRMASPSVLQLAGSQSERRMVSPSVSQPAGSQSKKRLVSPSVLQLAGSQSKARTRRPPTVDLPVARARRHRVERRCVADRALGRGQDRLLDARVRTERRRCDVISESSPCAPQRAPAARRRGGQLKRTGIKSNISSNCRNSPY
jgi:hypothetical protein